MMGSGFVWFFHVVHSLASTVSCWGAVRINYVSGRRSRHQVDLVYRPMLSKILQRACGELLCTHVRIDSKVINLCVGRQVLLVTSMPHSS